MPSAPSLALPRVAENNLITWLNCLMTTITIGQVRPLLAGVQEPAQNADADFTLIAEKLPDVVRHRFKLVHHERLQLLV